MGNASIGFRRILRNYACLGRKSSRTALRAVPEFPTKLVGAARCWLRQRFSQTIRKTAGAGKTGPCQPAPLENQGQPGGLSYGMMEPWITPKNRRRGLPEYRIRF